MPGDVTLAGKAKECMPFLAQFARHFGLVALYASYGKADDQIWVAEWGFELKECLLVWNIMADNDLEISNWMIDLMDDVCNQTA